MKLAAEAGAIGTSAVRRIEREIARFDFTDRDAAIGAGEVLGENHLLAIDHLRDRETVLPSDFGGPVFGYVFSEGRFDIGKKIDYLRATVATDRRGGWTDRVARSAAARS